jgi:hypothetical protein
MKTSRRSQCAARAIAAVVTALASAAGVAIAAQPAPGAQATRLEAAAPKPGPDGWYDARPIDESFVVRVPGVYQSFSEDGKTSAGAATHTVGVRANVPAAFGSVTLYVASCIRQQGDTRTPSERVQAVVDHWKKLGRMRFQRPIESGPDPGFEFEIADDVKVIRSRIYAPAVGTCTVLTSWRPYAKATDADIEKYLDSFEFLGR